MPHTPIYFGGIFVERPDGVTFQRIAGLYSRCIPPKNQLIINQMTNYDFSQLLSRKKSWEWENESVVDGHPILPMSVADTDFVSPREVTQTLREIIHGGELGYPSYPKDHQEVFANWQKQQHGWVLGFRETGWSQDEIHRFLIEDASLGFNRGDSFGANGSGFVRINCAVPELRIDEAIQRLSKAFQSQDNQYPRLLSDE
jgi:bifunctional pyridoxal-dependent enzyme with beta-cystathionase and maltose regulon repressor activities